MLFTIVFRKFSYQRGTREPEILEFFALRTERH